MMLLKRLIFAVLLILGLVGSFSPAYARHYHHQLPVICSQFNINAKASQPMQQVALPPADKCTTRMSNGYPIPDPNCTPGAIDPTVTVDVLRNPKFRTSCVRNQATSEHAKNVTYHWYDIPHPAHNTGRTQVCELDHLISLELGGADTLDNIWPQCGPDEVTLRQRYFKQKDIVENYLAKMVREGKMNLSDVQKGIATDWTQYLSAAKEACPSGRCK